MKQALTRLAVPLLMCLTLGLAPWTPEPHIVGKIRWVAGGAVGMGAMDWFDLVLHGAPFLLLAAVLVLEGLRLVGLVPPGRAKAGPEES